jgi:hypothetical protein
MADITYACQKCQITRMVSEFADPTKIRCKECDCVMTKGGLSAPAAHAPAATSQTPIPAAFESVKTSKLKLAREKPVELAPDETPGVIQTKQILPPEEKRAPLDLHPKTKAKKPIISQPVLAFLVFVIIGGLSYITVNGGFFDAELMEPFMEYAWIGILALHTVIVLKAFTEDMMQAILCLFIPGYSFLFIAISDLFFHKAIIFGLLVGIGLPGFWQLWDFAAIGLDSVHRFIDSGGGAVR